MLRKIYFYEKFDINQYNIYPFQNLHPLVPILPLPPEEILDILDRKHFRGQTLSRGQATNNYERMGKQKPH